MQLLRGNGSKIQAKFQASVAWKRSHLKMPTRKQAGTQREGGGGGDSSGNTVARFGQVPANLIHLTGHIPIKMQMALLPK